MKNISIIFPVYNEANRLDSSFSDIESFLNQKTLSEVELIFVDDGSNDNSNLLIQSFIEKIKKNIDKEKKFSASLVKSSKNLGKGSALKLGVEKAKKDWILTADIDMSVPLSQIFIWKTKNYIEDNTKVYFASRNLKSSEIIAKKYRKFLGFIFRFLVKFFLKINLSDTQCGFKLYSSSVAKPIFSKLQNKGFAHDLEIVLLLKLQKIEVVELPVKWTHKEKSKLNIFFDSIRMFVDIVLIKFKY